MASEYTPNRRYPLYVDSDKPNLRDQYNGAIREIDTDMAQALADSSEVSTALGAGFDAQHTVRMAIDAANSAVSAEVTARQNADTTLGTRIDNEVMALQNADTALGTRIDNEVTARQNADTALGNRIDNEVSARQNADSTLSNRISALENQTEYFAVIGDSFSNQDSEWPNIVASKTGLGVINKAYDGSGFSPASDTSIPTFIQQLNTLKNDANFNKVKHVIVYGGVNDWTNRNHTSAQTIAYVDAFINSWESISGIKPKITFVFGNVGAPERNFTRTYFGYPKYVREVCAHIRSLGYDAVEGFAFLLGYISTDVFNSDLLHPNALGEKIIASYMTQILNGTYNGVHNQYVATFSSNGIAGGLRLNIDGLMWSASAYARFTAATTLTSNYVQIGPNIPHTFFGTGSNTPEEIDEMLQSSKVIHHLVPFNFSPQNNAIRIVDSAYNPTIGGMFIRKSSQSDDINVVQGFDMQEWIYPFVGEIA